MLSPKKATIVTVACCYLHNFLRKKSDRYLSHGNVDWEDANYDIHNGEWRTTQRDLAGLCPTSRRNMTERAKFVRETLQRYRFLGRWKVFKDNRRHTVLWLLLIKHRCSLVSKKTKRAREEREGKRQEREEIEREKREKRAREREMQYKNNEIYIQASCQC